MLFVSFASALPTSPARATISESVLYSFPTQSNGLSSGLIGSSLGDYFGAAQNTLFKLSSSGVFSTLETFASGYVQPPIIAPDGKIYGSSTSDGANNVGIVYSISTDGSDYTVVHTFDQTDGSFPHGSLAFGNEGGLYGIADGPSGYEILYKIDPRGNIFTIETFSSAASGEDPSAPVGDGNGSLYGVATDGGSSNDGLIYQVCTTGEGFNTIFSFDGADGEAPFGQLTVDGLGNLYGNTHSGKNTDYGSIFGLSSDDKLSVLHTFTGGSDSGDPLGVIQLDPDGNLLSTTYGLSLLQHGGTIFMIRADGTYIIFYTFHKLPGGSDNTNTTGAGPLGSFVLDGKGDLVGTTEAGGANAGGVIWKLAVLPNVAQPASAIIDPTNGDQIDLSVLGSDDAYDESELKYQWIGSGPSRAVFSTNRSNAAKQTEATVSASGTYTFTVKIINPLGGVKTTKVSITVP